MMTTEPNRGMEAFGQAVQRLSALLHEVAEEVVLEALVEHGTATASTLRIRGGWDIDIERTLERLAGKGLAKNLGGRPPAYSATAGDSA